MRIALLAIAGRLSLLAAFVLAGRHGTIITLTMFILAAVWGASWWSAGIAQQHRLTSLAPHQHADILALHYSLQYLGIAMGGALGGMALTLWGPVGVALSAALIAALTLFSVTAAKPEHVGIGQPAHGR